MYDAEKLAAEDEERKSNVVGRVRRHGIASAHRGWEMLMCLAI